MTILIINSEKIDLAQVLEALENKGCTHHVADHEEDALAYLAENTSDVDAILLDEDKFTDNDSIFIKKFSLKAAYQDIPLVVFLGGQYSSDDLHEKFPGGCYWVHSPLNIDAMMSNITSALDDHNQRRALRQEIKSRESVIGSIQNGTFRIRTFDQAEKLTTMLSLACPEPDRIALGLFELIANGIEHGNLGIDFEEKRQLIEQGKHRDEINRRLSLPENMDKYVEIRFEQDGNVVTFKIADCGDGFDVKTVLEREIAENTMALGRGIELAKATSFDYLEYIGKGNRVLAVAKFD